MTGRAAQRLIAASLYAAVFTAVAASVPYLPVYYESLGLALDAIGVLAAVTALCALLAAAAWGVVADALQGAGLGGVRLVLVAAALLSTASAVGLWLAIDPTLAVLVAVMFSLSFYGIGPVLDSHALALEAEDQHRYARLRLWGSVAFMVGSLGVGLVIQASNLRAMFVVLVAALLATALVATRVRSRRPRARSSSERERLAGLRYVLRSRTLMVFIAAALIAWSASTAMNGFLSIYLTSIGASAVLVGGAWAIGSVVEIPLLLAFPFLANRLGVERLLVAGAGLLLLRGIVVVAFDDPLVVAGSMILHGGGFALLLVGGVAYVARHSPPMASATAQGVLSGVVFGLAQAIGPGAAGIIAGNAGLDLAFVVATVASAIGLVAVALAVRGNAQIDNVSATAP